MGRVDVDDAAVTIFRFANGATGTVERLRVAVGRKNHNRFEINGSKGSLVFDLERLNELQLYEERGPNSGFRTILVTDPAHPYAGRWWPPGHIIGFEHSFVHAIADLVDAVATNARVSPDFDDGLAIQRIIEAAERSNLSNRWEECRV